MYTRQYHKARYEKFLDTATKVSDLPHTLPDESVEESSKESFIRSPQKSIHSAETTLPSSSICAYHLQMT